MAGEHEEIIATARFHAEELSRDMSWTETEYGGFWEADERILTSLISARLTAALDFVDRNAGHNSRWSRRAEHLVANNGDNQSMESGAQAVGELLGQWASEVEAGRLQPSGQNSRGYRQAIKDDLIGQAAHLLEDDDVHPAAPILLCGSAIEISLRSLIDELELEVNGRPSIAVYAHSLRRHDYLNTQDMKEIEVLAGLRNAAAHGMFEDLSTERAGLAVQQVLLLVRRLDELRP